MDSRTNFELLEEYSRIAFCQWLKTQVGHIKIKFSDDRFEKNDFKMHSGSTDYKGSTNSVGEIKHRSEQYSASTLLLEYDKYIHLMSYSNTEISQIYNVQPYYVNVFKEKILIFNLFKTTITNWEWAYLPRYTATGTLEKKWKLVTLLNQNQAQIYLLDR